MDGCITGEDEKTGVRARKEDFFDKEEGLYSGRLVLQAVVFYQNFLMKRSMKCNNNNNNKFSKCVGDELLRALLFLNLLLLCRVSYS